MDRTTCSALSALSLLLASCSGNLPGTRPEEPQIVERPSGRRLQTRVVRSESESVVTASAPPLYAGPSAPSEVVVAPPSAQSPLPPHPTSAPPAPPPSAAIDARDRQFEILNEAVMALRQEVSRSYAHSQEVTQENQRLRALVTALRSELAKTRSDNQAIRSQLRTVEKRLKEVRITPSEPKADEAGGEAAEVGAAANQPPPEPPPRKSVPEPRPRATESERSKPPAQPDGGSFAAPSDAGGP